MYYSSLWWKNYTCLCLHCNGCLIFVVKFPGLGSNRWEVEELSVINGPWGFFGFVPLEVQSVCSPTFLQCFAKQVQFVILLKLIVFIIGLLGFRPIHGCCRKANAEPGTNDGWSFERIGCWYGGGSLSSYLAKCQHTNGSFLFPVVVVGRGLSSLLGLPISRLTFEVFLSCGVRNDTTGYCFFVRWCSFWIRSKLYLVGNWLIALNSFWLQIMPYNCYFNAFLLFLLGNNWFEHWHRRR